MEDAKNKKIDGIRKLNQEELAKSRQIVLDTIGDRQEKPALAKMDGKTVPGKKVDGLASRMFKKEKTAEPIPITEEKKKRWRIEAEKLMPEKSPVIASKPAPLSYTAPAGTERPDKAGYAPDFTKISSGMDSVRSSSTKITESPKPSPALKTPAEAAIIRKKLQAEENRRIESQAEENRRKEQVRAAKEKEENEKKLLVKKIAQETERKKRDKEEARRIARENRSRKRQKMKDDFARNLKELKIKAGIMSRVSVYLFSVCIITLFLLYSMLAIAELKFSADNAVLRSISRYFPVPAIITGSGIIEYYRYKDMISGSGGSLAGIPGDEIKNMVAKDFVYSQLKEKYNLTGADIADEETIAEAISSRIINDQSINQVGLERIKKIKELIGENGDFVQTASKYGDELGQVTITPNNEKDYPYTNKVQELVSGEVSDVIATPQGYYIFRCYDRAEDRIALSYSFVRAKTLDEYIIESARTIKIWSLVK